MLSKIKYAKNLSSKFITGPSKSRNYVTIDKEWIKIAQKQLKDTPAEKLIWKTPEVHNLNKMKFIVHYVFIICKRVLI
jgi:hypothetical protein